ncbi:MAG: hypothetical protein M3139_12095 [Bacteroidota bacterium]|nr:hypothetical protein [Bacteroidota bacterium]
MDVLFKISITKEILASSKDCGINGDTETIGKNCAIAIALKDIFPDVFVTDYHIYPQGLREAGSVKELKIMMPKIAQDFVKIFDSLKGISKLRLLLPEFDFEILIPDEFISQINIEELTAITSNSPLPVLHC